MNVDESDIEAAVNLCMFVGFVLGLPVGLTVGYFIWGNGMKIKNGMIIKATEKELYRYYLKRGLDDIYSFPDYVEQMKKLGVEVKEQPNIVV